MVLLQDSIPTTLLMTVKKEQEFHCSSLYINGGGLNFNEEQTPHK